MNVHPILHVEDSSEDAYLLKYAFKEAEIKNEVRLVTDGQQAIDYLSGNGNFSDRRLNPMPCLVLLDLKLPHKTGLEVLEWIRSNESFKWLVVIVLSASANENDVRRAYSIGVNGFLVKPSNLKMLTDMCRALKHYWITYNEPPAQCWSR